MKPFPTNLPTRWRRPLTFFAIAGVELWVLLIPKPGLDSAGFELLCALSCWMPAWCCADLLSTPRSREFPIYEWPPREVWHRLGARLTGPLLVLLLWCGTFTFRSLWWELSMLNPPFIRSISSFDDVGKVTLAWTTVFLSSGFAYGAAAGLCSALSRRGRRWLITPAVVVALSLVLFLLISLANSKLPGADPLSNVSSDPAQFWRTTLTSPNYIIGANSAMATLNTLDERFETQIAPLVQHAGSLLAAYSWIAALYFVIAGALCVAGIGCIAKNRYSRHPNMADGTVPPEEDTGGLPLKQQQCAEQYPNQTIPYHGNFGEPEWPASV